MTEVSFWGFGPRIGPHGGRSAPCSESRSLPRVTRCSILFIMVCHAFAEVKTIGWCCPGASSRLLASNPVLFCFRLPEPLGADWGPNGSRNPRKLLSIMCFSSRICKTYFSKYFTAVCDKIRCSTALGLYLRERIADAQSHGSRAPANLIKTLRNRSLPSPLMVTKSSRKSK